MRECHHADTHINMLIFVRSQTVYISSPFIMDMMKKENARERERKKCYFFDTYTICTRNIFVLVA